MKKGAVIIGNKEQVKRILEMEKRERELTGIHPFEGEEEGLGLEQVGQIRHQEQVRKKMSDKEFREFLKAQSLAEHGRLLGEQKEEYLGQSRYVDKKLFERVMWTHPLFKDIMVRATAQGLSFKKAQELATNSVVAKLQLYKTHNMGKFLEHYSKRVPKTEREKEFYT